MLVRADEVLRETISKFEVRNSNGPTAIFVVALVLSIVVVPLAMGQQTGKVYRIGYLAVPRGTPQSDGLEPQLR
jgi:hypothetical protein